MSDEQFQAERPELPDITKQPRAPGAGQPYPDDTSDLPKLGSLAQAARHKHLKQARNTLLVLGIIIAIAQGFYFFKDMGEVEDTIRQQKNLTPAQAQQAEMVAKTILVAIYGTAITVGVLFIVLSFFVQRHPVPILITALILYIGLQVGFAVFNWQNLLNVGIVVRIFIVVGLFKALQAGIAAQREEREAEAAGDYEA